jgi:hypothetical protein
MSTRLVLRALCFFLLSPLACSGPACFATEYRDGKICRDTRLTADAGDELAEDAAGDASEPAQKERDAALSVNAERTQATDGDGSAGSSHDNGPTTEDGGAAAQEPPAPDAGRDEAQSVCLTDSDRDGYGVGPSSAHCPLGEPRPEPGDCNDNDAKAFPGATEACNGIDDDCSPLTPDGAGACGNYACSNASCLFSCTTTPDCASGLHCMNSACVGGNDGEACTVDTDCTSGSCRPSGACGPKVASEGSCDSAADCQAGLACGQTGTCLLTVGSECTANTACASQLCFQKCLAKPGIAGAGCAEKADCELGLKCVSNTCTPI